MGLFFVLSFSATIFLLSIQRGLCAHIVGGNESIPHSRPYMAALSNSNFFKCGGTLINENWVLTAAHYFPKSGTFVVLSAHEQKNYKELERQYIYITNVFVYPGYTIDTFEHDIMLLKLKEKAQINQYVKLIQLPKPDDDDDIQPGTNCLVAGWGHTYFTQTERVDRLREVNLTVIDREICNDENHYNYSLVTMNKLCAGSSRGGKASCQGDSGGPLICGVEQRGIVSSAINCGLKQYPIIFTRLTPTYISWIQNIINDNQ